MANIETSDPFETSLNNVHELETFLHAFLAKLDEHKLKPGEDVTHYFLESIFATRTRYLSPRQGS